MKRRRRVTREQGGGVFPPGVFPEASSGDPENDGEELHPLTAFYGGQGKTFVMRLHENADLPGENPTAHRYQVHGPDGSLLCAGVGSSPLDAVKDALKLTGSVFQKSHESASRDAGEIGGPLPGGSGSYVPRGTSPEDVPSPDEKQVSIDTVSRYPQPGSGSNVPRGTSPLSKSAK